MTKKPETDEEMAAVRVGGTVTAHNAAIYLAPYDPAWPDLYESLARRIRAGLGSAVLALDHVGSTSVPGPCAPTKWLSPAGACASLKVMISAGLTISI